MPYLSDATVAVIQWHKVSSRSIRVSGSDLDGSNDFFCHCYGEAMAVVAVLERQKRER